MTNKRWLILPAVVIAAALLAWSAELEAVAAHTDWVIAVAFVIGASLQLHVTYQIPSQLAR